MSYTNFVAAITGGSRSLAIALAANLVMFVAVRVGLLFYPDLLPLLEMGSSVEQLVAHPWTFLTYGFVHVDFIHLLFNLLLLSFFGVRLGRLSGGMAFWSLYFAGAIAGAAMMLLLAGDGASLIGSSASTMAIAAGATVANPHLHFRPFGLFDMKLYQLLLLFVAIDLLTLAAPDATSHGAHLAGVLAGALLAFMMLRLHRPKSSAPKVIATPQGKDPEIEYIMRKLRTSGHASLTDDEKRKLFNLK